MSLQEIRSQIDQVDEAILALFLERMRLAEQVAQVKKDKRLPVYNAEREQEILMWATDRSGELADYSRQFFASMFELSRKRQMEILQLSETCQED